MATSIKKSAFSTSWLKEYTCGKSSSGTRYVYICAPVWYCFCESYYDWGNGDFQIDAYYWNGSSWVHSWGKRVDWDHDYYFGHNHSEGKETGNYNSDYPLWKFVYYSTNNTTKWNLRFWIGTWGTDTTGINITGKKIRSIGRSGDLIHDSGTTDAGSPLSGALASIFNYSSRTGAKITTSTINECVYYPYLT